MRPQPLVAKLARSAIAVHDVEASSCWYHQVLGCQNALVGPIDERLIANGMLVLQLHHFALEDHHGPIADPNEQPYGNGVLPRHQNPPSGDGGPNHWECSLRDLDGSTVVLASPDGPAQGKAS